MMKKIYRTMIATVFLMNVAMPAMAGSGPVQEKTQQHSGRMEMETHQVMEQNKKEMKETAEDTAQQEQKAEKETMKKHGLSLQ